jgi:hypothetical protein
MRACVLIVVACALSGCWATVGEERLRECETRTVVFERGVPRRSDTVTVETTLTPPSCGRAGLVLRERR